MPCSAKVLTTRWRRPASISVRHFSSRRAWDGVQQARPQRQDGRVEFEVLLKQPKVMWPWIRQGGGATVAGAHGAGW